MIMGDKSVSIILYSDEVGLFNSNVMEVWFKIAKGYRHGAELILVSFSDGVDTSIDEFMYKHQNDGVRIVGITANDNNYYLCNLIKETMYQIEGDYVWVSEARSYPNSDILPLYADKMEPQKVLLGTKVFIKEPFNYTHMRPSPMNNSVVDDRKKFDARNFVVHGGLWIDTGSFLKGTYCISPAIAEAWYELRAISFEEVTNAEVFFIERT